MAKERDAKIRLTAETGPLQKGMEATQKAYDKFAKTAKESLETLSKNSKAFDTLVKSSKGFRDAIAADVKQLQSYRKSVDEVGKVNSKLLADQEKLKKGAEGTGKAYKQLSSELGDSAKGFKEFGQSVTKAQTEMAKLSETVDKTKFDSGVKQVDKFSDATENLAKTAKEGAAETGKAFDAIADGSKSLGEVTEQAAKAEGGLKALFSRAGNGLKAFGWVADVAQRVGILTTAVTGLASAGSKFVGAFTGGGLDRIPEALALINASGVSTGSLEQLSLLKDAFLGNQAAVQQFGVSAVSAFNDFNAALTQVNTIFRAETPEALEKLGNDMQALANGPLKNLITSTEALGGQYQVLSGGFTDAAESQQVLNAGLKLSVVGYNDSGSTLSLLVKTMRAYGFESSRALQTAAELNTVVEKGITTIPELSAGFGATATTAAQAGLGIQELGAAVAALTTKGTSTPEALTGVEALLRTIISKTPQAEAALAKLSAETGKTFRFDTQELKDKGLVAILRDLQSATKGNAATLREIIPDSLAFSTALGLMADNGQAFADSANALNNSTTENFQDVFESISEDQTKRFEAVVNRAQELLIEFGKSLTPLFEGGIKTIETLVDIIDRIPGPVQNAIAASLILNASFRKAADGVFTLAGTFVDVVKQIVLFRAVNLLFQGDLLNEIKIIKFRIIAQNDLGAAFKQTIGLNRQRAASLAEAVAWEQKDVANQKGLLQSLKESVTARFAQKSATEGVVAATTAEAAATGASTAAEEANTAARVKGSGVKQVDLQLQVASASAEAASTATTNANTTALTLNAGANKGLVASIRARFIAAQAAARFTQAEVVLEKKNTAAKLTSAAAEKAKLIVDRLSLVNIGQQTKAIAANVATQAVATAKKVKDTAVSTTKLTVDVLSTKNLALNTKALQIFTATIVKDTIAKITNTKATFAASGAGAALAIVTGGLSKAFGLLTKAALIGAKAMLAFLANPLVLAGLAALSAGILIFREVTSGATGQIRKANKSLNEIIDTAANAENQFTRTAESFKDLQDEFTRDGRRKEELGKAELERIEKQEKERERLIKKGLEKGQTFEQASFRADIGTQNARERVASVFNPLANARKVGAFASESTAIIAGRIANPREGRVGEQKQLADREQAYRDRVLGIETLGTGPNAVRGRDLSRGGFDKDGNTVDAILPTIDRLNAGLGITKQTADKSRQGQAITAADLKREQTAYEEILAPLEAYIAGKEAELEDTNDPARREAIAKDIQDLNKQADAYKEAKEQGLKYLEVQGQINQRLAINAQDGGAGKDFAKGFQAQFDESQRVLDETLAAAEKGQLDDINKLDDAAARYADQVNLGFTEGIDGFKTAAEAADKLRELRDRTITSEVEGVTTTASALTAADRRELTVGIADLFQQESDSRVKVIENENALLEKAGSLRLDNSKELEAQISANNLKASKDRLSTLEAQIKEFKEYTVSTVELEKQAAQQRKLIRLQELEDSFAALERDENRRAELLDKEVRDNQLALAKKTISQEDAAKRAADISIRESQSSLQTIEGQIAKARAAGESTVDLEKDAAKVRGEIELKVVNEKERQYQRQLDLKKLSLDNEVGAVRLALQAETDIRIQAQEAAIRLDQNLADSRNKVLDAQSNLEINRLANAQQQTADQVQQARIGVQLAEARNKQQQDQFVIEQQQLEIQFKLNNLGLEREAITNRLAQLENKVAQQKLAIELSEARRNKASNEEITALELQASLLTQQGEALGQQGDQIQDTIKAQDELNSNALAELSIRGQMVAENGVMAVQEAKLQEMTAQMEKQQKLMAVQSQQFEARAAQMLTINNAQAQFLSLEQQILAIRKESFQSGQSFVEGQYEILIATAKNGKERKKLEKELGQTRLSMLREAQKLEKLNLEINIQQLELALERKKLENQIAQVKNEAEIKSAQAEVERQKALRDAGKATDLDVQAAEAGLQGAIAQGAGTKIESVLLGREDQLLDTQSRVQRQSLERTQSLQSDQALFEYAQSLPRGDRERRRIERQFKQNRDSRLNNTRSTARGLAAEGESLSGTLGPAPDLTSLFDQFSRELSSQFASSSTSPTSLGQTQGSTRNGSPGSGQGGTGVGQANPALSSGVGGQGDPVTNYLEQIANNSVTANELLKKISESGFQQGIGGGQPQALSPAEQQAIRDRDRLKARIEELRVQFEASPAGQAALARDNMARQQDPEGFDRKRQAEVDDVKRQFDSITEGLNRTQSMGQFQPGPNGSGELAVTGGPGSGAPGASPNYLEVISTNSGIITSLLKNINSILSGDRPTESTSNDSPTEPASFNIQITQNFGEGGTSAMADDAKRQIIEMFRRDREELTQAARGN